MLERRVFVSMPADDALTDRENTIKWSIVRKISDLGYQPQIFNVGDTGGRGLPEGLPWNSRNADDVMRRCCGAVLIGLPRWRFTREGGDIFLATELSHYEGALANVHQLPTLVIADERILQRGVFSAHETEFARLPATADESWLSREAFVRRFDRWTRKLEERRDVFLGYCSSSAGVAANLRRFLASELKATTLDWADGFLPAGTILEEITTAASRCTGAIFLFTRDDTLNTPDAKAIPRDNVVFEAGFFIRAKGKEHVLIVIEEGAKIPADIGGDIYAKLTDRSSIEPLLADLRRFVNMRL